MQRLLGERRLSAFAFVVIVVGIALAVLSLLGAGGAWILEAATVCVLLGLVLIALDRRPRRVASR